MTGRWKSEFWHLSVCWALQRKWDSDAAAAAAAKSLQFCLTLCDPIDGNPPGLRGELKQTDFAVVHTTVTYKASSFPRTDSLSTFFRQQSLGPWLFSTQTNLHAKDSDWGVKFCWPTLARVEREPTESHLWYPLKICTERGPNSRAKLVLLYRLAFFCSLS